jgi:diguanylate cyclase (GGDEF)-like protein
MSNPPQIPSSEESFFELLAETLESMDHGPRGQFLQRFFKTVTQLDLTESMSLEYWERMLQHRRELVYSSGKPVSLKAAMLDVLASSMLDPPQIPSSEESFFELLAETLERMEQDPRGQFLQRFFNAVTQLDLTESMSLEYWEGMLRRRRDLANSLDKPISLKTAMLDVLASSPLLRVPVVMEYYKLKELQRNAATDPLTGLNNRRQFEEHFEKELNRARRYNENFALVILDLHLFKEANDLYGHPRGDLLLKNAADAVRKSLRISDYAFRIGGDEFALLLVHADAEQATALARRMRAAFASSIEPMQMGIELGIDYGIAVFPKDGDQIDVLIRVADERLYEMKKAQRTPSAQARHSKFAKGGAWSA